MAPTPSSIPSFGCNGQIEDEYRVESMPVHWYVVSDCAALPYKAAERYGGKVLPCMHTIHN